MSPDQPQIKPSEEAGSPQPRPALAEHSSTNFAPIKPLLALQRGDTKTESTVGAALRERFKHHYSMEKQTWADMNLMGSQVANFIEGRQLIRPNPWIPGAWLPYTPTTDSQKRALNFTRFYTSNELFKWLLSVPDVVATMGIDTEEARESADAADTIIEHYERKFFQPFVTIQEALQGLCWGTYIWDVRYDQSEHSLTALQPLFAPQNVSVPGYGTCGTCGFSGPSDAFPNSMGPVSPCPECGGQAMVETPQAQIQSMIGTQQIPLGDLVARLRPFPQCRWDIRHRIEESSWAMFMQRTSLTNIRRLLGPLRLPQAGDEVSDVGLEIMDKLPWMGQSGGGTASADNRRRSLYEEPVTVIEYSLSADDIADIRIKANEDTIGGQPILAGSLADAFPDGIVVQGLNGLSVITGIFAEHHRNSTVSGVWHAKAVSGTGQGLNDLIEVQKRFNADDSMVHAYMRATSTPAMLARVEALGEQGREQYLADPHTTIPITAQNLPEGMRLEDIVRPAFTPQSIPGNTFDYIYNRLNNFAQLTSHITDFSGGLPGVNNDTATGAQITQANSNALFTPVLQVKGEVRMRIARLVLDLYRRHFPIDRYFPLKGRYGRQQGKYLNGANLSTDIELEVVKDSELPKNSHTKREDYVSFLTLMGGFPGYDMARSSNPELVVDIERAFNFPVKSETFNQIASLCQQRLMQMKTVADMVPNPMAVLMGIQPPLAPEELNQEMKAKWFAEWLDDDEGQEANPVLRMAVQMLIQQLFQGHIQQSAMIAMGSGAVQAAGGAMMPQPGGPAGGGDKGKPNGPPPNPEQSQPNVNNPGAGRFTGRPAPQSPAKQP